MLIIDSLTVSVENKNIISSFSCTLLPGSTHLLMGPNGVGKSSLVQALSGHPKFTVGHGIIKLNGQDITTALPHIRAKAGLFIVTQYQPVLPGVGVMTFLTEIYNAHYERLSVTAVREKVITLLPIVQLNESFLERSVHEGFSGGERKRFELLQMMLLTPQCIVLDEIDSGLAFDALSIIVESLAYVRSKNPSCAILIITHYPRLARLLAIDQVHVLYKGAQQLSGDASLLEHIEEYGYGS
jgi:Fe-S cluster assembly ATP-binding protein